MSEHHHHNVSGKNLFITIALNIIITIAQILGGIVSGSLALLSDAIHNFSDILTSVAVVVGGILIYFYQIYWVDPLISVIIAFYLVWASFDLIRE